MGASLESRWAWLRWALRRWTAHSINSLWQGSSHQISSFPAQALLGGAAGAPSPSLPSAQAPAPSTSQPFPLVFSTWDDSWAPILSEELDPAPPLALASSKFLGYKFTAVSAWVWCLLSCLTPTFQLCPPIPSMPAPLWILFSSRPSVISWPSIPYLLRQHTLLGNVCLLVLFLVLSGGSPEQRSLLLQITELSLCSQLPNASSYQLRIWSGISVPLNPSKVWNSYLILLL